jgi:malate synthase
LLLAQREVSAETYRTGGKPTELSSTAGIRAHQWRVADPPPDLSDRRCEITGPADRKMIISALNSGARVYMADLEDSLAPSWTNIVSGHRNLRDAADMTITYERPDGRVDVVSRNPATLVVRPRGLHLAEPHIAADGRRASASIFDVALLALHCAARREAQGSGLYLYLPKIESYHEAQWWDALLADVERRCGLRPNSVRVTVLIETLPAAFQMEEILFALRDRITALNAGRWDYLFSVIKVLGLDSEHILADRRSLTMSAPFMAAYATRLVEACHRRGAYAIGGMAAFVPERGDDEVTRQAMALVKEDKVREARLGYDGTWVAHPDLVAVATDAFDAQLGSQSNQLGVIPPNVPGPEQLLETSVQGARATLEGAKSNFAVALEYLVNWISGRGAVAINHLMEDLATAEICRGQLWQWLHSGADLGYDASAPIVLDEEMVRDGLHESAERLVAIGYDETVVVRASAVIVQSVLQSPMAPFLSVLAAEALEETAT